MKIGLMLPLAADETSGWSVLKEMAIAAEEGGLDSVWGADHLIFRDDGETVGIHESWTLLTAVAAVTSRVEIGPLVLALPFRNPALTAKMGTDLFVFHGFTELYLEGKWVKATPAFNLALCTKFRVKPLEFDGTEDSIFHPFDEDNRRHMEYVRDRGSYADVPADEIRRVFAATYPSYFNLGPDARKEAFEPA